MEVSYDDKKVKKIQTGALSMQMLNNMDATDSKSNNSLPPINLKGSSLPPITSIGG